MGELPRRKATLYRVLALVLRALTLSTFLMMDMKRSGAALPFGRSRRVHAILDRCGRSLAAPRQ